MSKKKQPEDNRDIFDKALDNAPLIGSLVGATAGALGMRRIAKKRFGGSDLPQATVLGGYTGALGGLVAGNSVKDTRDFVKKPKRRK